MPRRLPMAGFILMLLNGAIDWSAKQLKVVADSTCEAETASASRSAHGYRGHVPPSPRGCTSPPPSAELVRPQEGPPGRRLHGARFQPKVGRTGQTTGPKHNFERKRGRF